jgi:integrase
MRQRSGGWRWIKGRRYARVRVTANQRPSIPLVACTTDEEADARTELIAFVANKLIKGGRADRVKDICEQIGAATSTKHLAILQKAADRLIATSNVAPHAVTVKEFARRWTSGELHLQYPDHVKKKQSVNDAGTFAMHILPHVGDVPLAAFRLEDAELVMGQIPAGRSKATRRHIAQTMNRLLNLAVYPAKILKVNPLPKGFLPKLGDPKAKPYLYPADDRKLLACQGIPLERRIVWGVLSREGLRVGDLLGSASHSSKEPREPITWGDFDLALGAINLDKNKTNDPRSWALDRGVVAALRAWKKISPRTKLTDPVFPNVDRDHMGGVLRDDLKLAGVDRPELFERSASRAQVTVHHLRGTFVTLALANGKTETWVQDRTGHTSSVMINRYRRTARTAAELGIGLLAPLVEAVPELREVAARLNGAATTGATKGQNVGIQSGNLTQGGGADVS